MNNNYYYYYYYYWCFVKSKVHKSEGIFSFCVRVSVVLNAKVKFTKDVQHATSKEGNGNAVV